jgi:DNA topoisomerase-1
MTNLVIVESPAKCQKIQGFLGPGWRVIATMGHIRALEETLEAIGIERDFEAKYQFIKEKAKAIKQIKDAAAEASTIYLASDLDREGESISYAVCLLLKLDPKKTFRIAFQEITKKAIINAVESPRYLDMNIVNAQQSRAILDMMIGFTMSPLLWRYVAPSLSAGRCQTPALRLVVEREDQIKNFKASSSWQLSANFTHGVAEGCFPAKMDDELEDEESALNYMEIIHQTPEATIQSKDIRPWSEKAPEPLITSTLQQQASALYSINPKNTMKIAQKLYEAGHITYHRTDKPVLSEEATAEAKKWVQETYGEEYVGAKKTLEPAEEKEGKKGKKKPKVADVTKKEGAGEVKAQEAHEAIRPTHMEVTELPQGGDWTTYDKKVYNLIWQRTIQSVMSPAKGETCKIKIQIDSSEESDEDFTWSNQWKRTTFEGWKRAGKVAQIDDNAESDASEEDSKEDTWIKATKMKVGDKVQWKDMKAEPKETKAQGRYTEATLVRELEKFGIGRPSTFASLIATIQDKNYVETKDIPAKEVSIKEYSLKPTQWPPQGKDLKKKVGAEKNKLVPTDLGRSVLNFMLKHFNDLFDYGFTAQMEKRLDHIASGEEFWKQVLRDMWASYKDRYEDLTSKQALTSGSASEQNARVKEFNNAVRGLKAVQSKKGPLLLIEGAKKEDTQFLGWPQGIAFEDMTEEIALKFKEETIKKKTGDEIGEWNEQPIVKKTGKFGDYLQCGEVSIPFQADELIEKTVERFEAKQNGGGAINVIKQFKDYVIRTGQYGPYIMKTSLKKPQFVSLPKGVDATNLTEKEVEALYKTGLETKKKWTTASKKPAK